MNNLSIAFPGKSEQEKVLIAKKFYRNFTDSFIETIKLLSANNNFIKKHFEADTSIFDKINDSGKKCQVHLGHNFNWELANVAMPLYVHQFFLTVYMPIENKIFNRLFMKIRSRTGTHMISATKISRELIPWRNKQYILTMVADQSPAVPTNAFWIHFFGRPTPFVRGPENGARLFDMAIVFTHLTKIKRGYYKAHFHLEAESSKNLEPGEITLKYVRYLENVISTYPDMWLWSHRRWKFEWKEEFGLIADKRNL